MYNNKDIYLGQRGQAFILAKTMWTPGKSMYNSHQEKMDAADWQAPVKENKYTVKYEMWVNN